MTGTLKTVSETKFSRLWTNGWFRPVVIILGLGTFLAILGPYGSSSIGWPWVWIYWTGLIGLGGAFGFLTGHWLPRLFPKVPEGLVYVAAIMTVSVPVTIAVIGLDTGFFTRAPSLARLGQTYLLVLVISTFVTAVTWVIERLTKPQANADSAPSASSALLEKLPHRLRRATIVSMSAEDHYLRVRTDKGEALILMRLSDAVAACGALHGARTHRSWWVARDAVGDVQKGDGRATLTLTDGTEAPVSRSYYAKLREDGWF